MSTLEVLQTYPSQRKILLSVALGVVDPSTLASLHSIWTTQNLSPLLGSFPNPGHSLEYHYPLMHYVDEGASTCIMSKIIWQKLGSLELTPSAITLWAYDGPISTQGDFSKHPHRDSRKNGLD
jgi:hypothetical protein